MSLSSSWLVCFYSLLDVAQKNCTVDDSHRQIIQKMSPAPGFLSPTSSNNHVRKHILTCTFAIKRFRSAFCWYRPSCKQGLGIVPPSPSPTEPQASLLAAHSEQQVSRHILHLKELLRVNQSQLAAGMGAAGLLKSGLPQSLPVSPAYISSIPMQSTPMSSRAIVPHAQNLHLGAPFTHSADGTRYSEETIVTVPSRTNSFNSTVNPEAVSPSFSPSGYVRRQAWADRLFVFWCTKVLVLIFYHSIHTNLQLLSWCNYNKHFVEFTNMWIMVCTHISPWLCMSIFFSCAISHHHSHSLNCWTLRIPRSGSSTFSHTRNIFAAHYWLHCKNALATQRSGLTGYKKKKNLVRSFRCFNEKKKVEEKGALFRVSFRTLFQMCRTDCLVQIILRKRQESQQFDLRGSGPQPLSSHSPAPVPEPEGSFIWTSMHLTFTVQKGTTTPRGLVLHNIM